MRTAMATMLAPVTLALTLALALAPAAQASPAPAARAAPAGLQQHSLRVGGVRLHYAEMGSGDPVLLLPGWPRTATPGARSRRCSPRAGGAS